MKRGREGICKRSCCWSPQGVCGMGGACTCHTRGIDAHAREERRKQDEMRHQEAVLAARDAEIQRAEAAGVIWTR